MLTGICKNKVKNASPKLLKQKEIGINFQR